MAEDQPAQRARDEADGVGGEREQRADGRFEVGEEELVEHERRRGAVEEEVVPLQRRADQAREDHALRCAGQDVGVGGQGRRVVALGHGVLLS
jgi:hypothetical protein